MGDGRSNELPKELGLNLRDEWIESLRQEGHIGHLRALVVVGGVIEHEGRRHPEESADLADGELPAVEEFHVHGGQGEGAELCLPRQAHNALPALEAGVQILGRLLQLGVLILPESSDGGVIAHDAPDIAPVGKAVEGLLVTGGSNAHCLGSEGQSGDAGLAVQGEIHQMDDLILLEVPGDALLRITDMVDAIESVMGDGAPVAKDKHLRLPDIHQGPHGYDVGVAVEMDHLHSPVPEVEGVVLRAGADIQQVRDTGPRLIGKDPIASPAHVAERETCHSSAKHGETPVHSGDAEGLIAPAHEGIVHESLPWIVFLFVI